MSPFTNAIRSRQCHGLFALALFICTFNLYGQQPVPSDPAALSAALTALGPKVTESIQAHQALYLGSKTPEMGSKLPAILWYIGEAMSRGGDLTAIFDPCRELSIVRNADTLQALADKVEALAPKAEALVGPAHATAEEARRLAKLVAGAANAGVDPAAWPKPANPNAVSEPEALYDAALAALSAGTPDFALASTLFAELAARLDYLADLDRWLALNCRWLAEDNTWTKEPGLAPRSLCYCIAARGNEAAFLQSRAEDILFTLDAERALWPGLAARRAGKPAPATPPPADATVAKQIAELKEKALAADRKASDLGHQRNINGSLQVMMKEYLPVAAELEYLQREAALRRWATKNTPGDLGLADADAAPLSLTARAALAEVVANLPKKDLPRFTAVLKDMLGRNYLASYVDLCLYQAAIVGVEKDLATRLSRWLALSKKPDPIELMDILHPTPGVMTTSQRGDNSYQPQLMTWAAQCKGANPEARFKEAREFTNAFYKQHGYNNDKPVNSLRDVLESGLVDCIAGSRIFGAVAAAGGVTGLVPARLWRDKTGHTVLGFRDKSGKVMIMDALAGDKAVPYPGGHKGGGTITFEIGVPTFGCYIVNDLEIVESGKRLTREVPYLTPAGAKKK